MFFIKKIVIVLALIVSILVFIHKESENDIPIESIRIRIIANSNSIEDQNIKLKVKDSVEKLIFNLTEDSTSIEETRSIINANLTNIESNIEETLINNKLKSDYTIEYGLNYFPKKEYKGKEYDEGNYESLVITLGEGKGDNWWCILFPPLCLQDTKETESNNVEYKFIVKEIIKHFM